MKKVSIYKLIALTALVGLITLSCSNDDATVDSQNQDSDSTSSVSSKNIELSTEMDNAIEVINNLSINYYDGEEKNTFAKPSINEDCAKIYISLNKGFKELLIDFGDGCDINGHIIKGRMTLEYLVQIIDFKVKITHTFDEFSIDGKTVSGKLETLRELNNENGNPQAYDAIDLTFTWQDGISASRKGSKTREWAEGFGTLSIKDNVFLITGDWTSTFTSGNKHTYKITEPLRLEGGCFYIVSGKADIQRIENGGILDYGAGECDNNATFTTNDGKVIDIKL